MIYIIGDRHGEEDGFSEEKLPGQSLWTADDIVIVTGDFGYVMCGERNNLPETARDIAEPFCRSRVNLYHWMYCGYV